MNREVYRKTAQAFPRMALRLLFVAPLLAAGPGNRPYARPVEMRLAKTASESSSLVADRGKFRILVNGQSVGKEEFEIFESGGAWTARGSTEIQVANSAAVRITAKLKLQPDGTPVSYEWTTEGAKKASSTVQFRDGKAMVELKVDAAQPYSQSFSFSGPRIAVLDNNLYHQYEILGRLYDWQKKGAQTIAVLVPQELTPGNVTVEALGTQEDHGKKVEAMRVRTEDLEVNLFFDGAKLVHLLVPSANAEILRE